MYYEEVPHFVQIFWKFESLIDLWAIKWARNWHEKRWTFSKISTGVGMQSILEVDVWHSDIMSGQWHLFFFPFRGSTHCPFREVKITFWPPLFLITPFSVYQKEELTKYSWGILRIYLLQNFSGESSGILTFRVKFWT